MWDLNSTWSNKRKIYAKFLVFQLVWTEKENGRNNRKYLPVLILTREREREREKGRDREPFHKHKNKPLYTPILIALGGENKLRLNNKRDTGTSSPR